ncbi:hypothetical protein CIB93_12005 [Streptomyces sp. WZ.A104]|nr:hypothetical protein CIB93_12005 [Streptomyces sp. WZ.A104]
MCGVDQQQVGLADLQLVEGFDELPFGRGVRSWATDSTTVLSGSIRSSRVESPVAHSTSERLGGRTGLPWVCCRDTRDRRSDG